MVSDSRYEIPEPDDCNPKEVFAFFGLASYHVQVLEKCLVIMVLAFRCKGLHITRREFDSLYAENSMKTFGQLLSRARKSNSIPNDIDSILEDALRKRNWLIHHYFADRAVQFTTEIGRRQMLDELQSLIRIFMDADRATETIYKPIFEELGVTEESVAKMIEEMVKEYLSKEKTDE